MPSGWPKPGRRKIKHPLLLIGYLEDHGCALRLLCRVFVEQLEVAVHVGKLRLLLRALRGHHLALRLLAFGGLGVVPCQDEGYNSKPRQPQQATMAS